MKRLDRCCCACTLKEGAVIIGAIYMVLAGLDALFSGLRAVQEAAEGVDEGKYRQLIVAARCTEWTIQALNFVMGALLVYGALKEKDLLLRGWVWYTSLAYGCFAILAIGYILMAIAFGKNSEAVVLSAVFLAVSVGVLYALRVVNSLYCQLLESRNMANVQQMTMNLSSTRQPSDTAMKLQYVSVV